MLGLRPPGLELESCVWRTVSSQSSHYPQDVLLAQFSLYVHIVGLKPDSFHLRTALQTQESKFKPCRSEAEHATSRSRRLSTILSFTSRWTRNTRKRAPNSSMKAPALPSPTMLNAIMACRAWAITQQTRHCTALFQRVVLAGNHPTCTPPPLPISVQVNHNDY